MPYNSAERLMPYKSAERLMQYDRNDKNWPSGCKQVGRFLCKTTKLQRTIALLCFCVCFVFCFALMVYGISEEKLQEKFIDLQSFLELISAHDSINADIEYIDRLPHVFAALYDSELNILSYRSPEEGTAPFDPRFNNEFKNLIKNNEYGTINIEWEDLSGGITKRTMHTCFRRIEPNYIIAAGISTYALISPTLSIFIGSVLAVFLILFIFLLCFAVYLFMDIHSHHKKAWHSYQELDIENK